MYSYLIYGFELGNPIPLDKRFVISSLTNITTELPMGVRYSGLLFFVKDTEKYYYFKQNLTIPVLLDFDSNEIFGIVKTNPISYNTLIVDLNNTGNNIGKIVTVFPLNVSFIFDGTIWKYYSGKYNVDDQTQFETIPATLRQPGTRVVYNNTTSIDRYIDENNVVVDLITTVSSLPGTALNGRMYKVNGKVYQYINNEWLSFGINPTILTNINFVADTELTLTHTQNSTFVRIVASWEDSNNIIRTTQLFPDSVTLSNFKFTPRIDLSNVTITIYQ